MRFDVEWRTGLYVMRDIGDRHYQSPAPLTPTLSVYGIIEVARVRAVDGDQRQRGEIPATDRIARRDAPGRAHIEPMRPVDRHAVAAKQGPGRPVGFVSCVQHGEDTTAVTPSVLPQQRHFDDVAVPRAPVVVLDFDATLDRRVQGLDEPLPMSFHDTPDERFGGRLDHAQPAVPLSAQTALAAGREFDAVAMTDIRPARQLGAGIFEHELAERLDDPAHFGRVDQRIASICRPRDLAQVFEPPQKAPKPMRAGTLRETEVPHKVVPLGRAERFQGVTDIVRDQLRFAYISASPIDVPN